MIQRTLNSVFSRGENESREVSHRVEAAFVCHWLSDDDIEARGVERVGGGEVSDCGFVGGGGAFEAFEDPFEDTAVFAVARPLVWLEGLHGSYPEIGLPKGDPTMANL